MVGDVIFSFSVFLASLFLFILSKKKEGKEPKTLVDDNAPCVFKKLRKN